MHSSLRRERTRLRRLRQLRGRVHNPRLRDVRFAHLRPTSTKTKRNGRVRRTYHGNLLCDCAGSECHCVLQSTSSTYTTSTHLSLPYTHTVDPDRGILFSKFLLFLLFDLLLSIIHARELHSSLVADLSGLTGSTCTVRSVLEPGDMIHINVQLSAGRTIAIYIDFTTKVLNYARRLHIRVHTRHAERILFSTTRPVARR